MTTHTSNTRAALICLLLILPLAATTGCSSARMALGYGLHTSSAVDGTDQGILTSYAVPVGDGTIQRHARPKPQATVMETSHLQVRPSQAAVTLDEMKPGTEDDSFTPADNDSSAP
jgi:hypothetical protein